MSSHAACVLDKDVAADTNGEDDGVEVAMDENSVVDDSPLGFLILDVSPSFSDSVCFLSLRFWTSSVGLISEEEACLVETSIASKDLKRTEK